LIIHIKLLEKPFIPAVNIISDKEAINAKELRDICKFIEAHSFES